MLLILIVGYMISYKKNVHHVMVLPIGLLINVVLLLNIMTEMLVKILILQLFLIVKNFN